MRISANGNSRGGAGALLNEDQQVLLQALIPSDKFILAVDFMSRNALDQQLENKTMDFEITVVLARQAFYTAGEEDMNTYFRDQSLKMIKILT